MSLVSGQSKPKNKKKRQILVIKKQNTLNTLFLSLIITSLQGGVTDKFSQTTNTQIVNSDKNSYHPYAL